MPDRTAGRCASRHVCGGHHHCETESGFITEDDTSPVCHTPKLPEPTYISSIMVSLDDTGCLEGGKWRLIDASDVVGAEVATLLIARSSRSFVFLGRPDPRDGTLYLL
ncbi:hypothetical protein TNCV_3778661 [Trichonephila clavipes]|nr:hypothetical protein TNCV_3778661 [Trichonephila clavipes]